MNVRALAFVAALLAGSTAMATEWVSRYDGGGDDDAAAAMCLAPNGSLYLAGSQTSSDTGDHGSEDIVVLRLNASNGALQNTASFRYRTGAEFDDGAAALGVSGTGNVYVAGFTSDSVIDDEEEDTLYFGQVTTLKYTDALSLVWASHTPPSNTNAKLEEPDVCGNALALRGDTSHVVADGFYLRSQDYDILTMRYAPATGETLWSDWYNAHGASSDGGKAVVLDGAGNIYSAGSAYYDTTTGRDLVILKYQPGGSGPMVTRYDGPYSGRSLAERHLPVPAK